MAKLGTEVMNMKQYKKTSFLSQKAYYLALAVGFVLLIALMVIYSQNMKDKQKLSKQEIRLDEVGNEAIQKTTESTTQADTSIKESTHRQAESSVAKTKADALSYNGKEKLAWPINGNVILPYSMDTTVYFETLDQYKCNPGLLIEAKEGDGIGAVTKCQVTEIKEDQEHGKEVIVDLGNDYQITFGQLKNIKVRKGDVLEKGSKIGEVATPTDYYTLEGSHVYMEMTHEGKPVNPTKYME